MGVEVLLDDAVDILKVMGNEQAGRWKKERVCKEFDKQVLFEEWDDELFKMYKFNRRLKRLLVKIAGLDDADEVEIIDNTEDAEDDVSEQEEFEDGTDAEEEDDDDSLEDDDEEDDDESEVGSDVVDDGAEDADIDGDKDDEGEVEGATEGVTIGEHVISVGDWVEVNDPAYPVPYKGQLKEIQNEKYGLVVTVHDKEWEQAFEHMTPCAAPKRAKSKPKLNRQQCVMKVLKGLKKPTPMGTVLKLSDEAFVDQGGKRKGNADQVKKYLDTILEVLVYFGKAKVEGKMVSVK